MPRSPYFPPTKDPRDASSLKREKDDLDKFNFSDNTAADGHPPLRNSAHLQMLQALAGAGSGFFTRFLTQPFDVLKIRFQLQVEPLGDKLSEKRGGVGAGARAAVAGVPHQSKYTSMLQACRLIYREEGVKAFWKGHNAGQYMTVLYTLIQFWSYEQFHLRLSQMRFLHSHEKTTDFVSGALAGSFGMLVAMPFDVIRTRIVAQDPGSGYKNVAQGFTTIVHTEGMRGLFRGFGPTIMQIGPLVGGNFMFYNSANNFAKKFLKPHDDHLPTWCLLVTGGFSGVASKALVYPLDFVKKRLQIRGFETCRKTFGRTQYCTNSFNCITMTLRDEGVKGFYKGIWPTLLKSGFTTALYFGFYDTLKMYLLDREGSAIHSG